MMSTTTVTMHVYRYGGGNCSTHFLEDFIHSLGCFLAPMNTYSFLARIVVLLKPFVLISSENYCLLESPFVFEQVSDVG